MHQSSLLLHFLVGIDEVILIYLVKQLFTLNGHHVDYEYLKKLDLNICFFLRFNPLSPQLAYSWLAYRSYAGYRYDLVNFYKTYSSKTSYWHLSGKEYTSISCLLILWLCSKAYLLSFIKFWKYKFLFHLSSNRIKTNKPKAIL